jgi:hypothetical protein
MSGLCDDDYDASKIYPAGRLEWDMDEDVWKAYVQPAPDAEDVYLGQHATLNGARDLVYDWVLEQEGGKA